MWPRCYRSWARCRSAPIVQWIMTLLLMCLWFSSRAFSYTPVSRIRLWRSKHIVNMNSWSGSLKLFHKSTPLHHIFLLLFDVQMRFGETVYWIIACSVSAKRVFLTRHNSSTVLQILTTVSICANSSIDYELNVGVCPILTATICSWWAIFYFFFNNSFTDSDIRYVLITDSRPICNNSSIESELVYFRVLD